MTCRAFHSGDLRRMWKLLDGGVAVRAAENPMDAFFSFGLIHVDAVAGFVFEILVPMAGEAIEGLWFPCSARLHHGQKEEHCDG